MVKSVLDEKQDGMTKRVWTHRDAASFGAMYERLRRFAGAVGPWEVEPEDLLQEALVRALRGGPLSRLDHPEAYLRRTIVNLSHSFIRRRHTTERVHTTIYGRDESVNEPDYPSDLADLLSLEPTSRAVIYLHDVEGYSFPEIETALSIPAATCRQIASRSRRHIRRQLEEEAQK
jgi:DNA-directed RNA polymerase specialized sigma24 family protein